MLSKIKSIEIRACRGGDELEHDLAALWAFEVHRHALLVAVEQRVKTGAAAQQLAGAVARQGLDLDDICTQVAQRHAASGPHDHVGEFDDADAREGES